MSLEDRFHYIQIKPLHTSLLHPGSLGTCWLWCFLYRGWRLWWRCGLRRARFKITGISQISLLEYIKYLGSTAAPLSSGAHRCRVITGLRLILYVYMLHHNVTSIGRCNGTYRVLRTLWAGCRFSITFLFLWTQIHNISILNLSLLNASNCF